MRIRTSQFSPSRLSFHEVADGFFWVAYRLLRELFLSRRRHLEDPVQANGSPSVSEPQRFG